jgi:hypothetical protein
MNIRHLCPTADLKNQKVKSRFEGIAVSLFYVSILILDVRIITL